MRRCASWCLSLLVMLTSLTLYPAQAQAGTGQADLPDWLEPRGLSVVELVGQVPESYLRDTIISYNTGTGIVVYQSGIRTGNRIVVTTTIYPRFSTPDWATNKMLTTFGCLGQYPYYDHMGSVAPASSLRIYDSSGVDVTSQIQFMFLTNMGTRQPSAGSKQYDRYPPLIGYGVGLQYPLPIGPGGLNIPVNSGCVIMVPGKNYTSLTGVFTLSLDLTAIASVVGVQSANFTSYIGPGTVGIFEPLMRQLQATYGNRDMAISMNVPAEADCFFLKYPPMPGDPYADWGSGYPYYNADRPSGGTYRLARGAELSADLVFSAVFPLKVAWRDADQSRDSMFLPMLVNPPSMGAPEYILPAGIQYNPCFTQGNCPSEILQQIFQTTMKLEIVYLSLETPPAGGEWTSLRMAGPAWSPSAAASPSTMSVAAEPPSDPDSTKVHVSAASTTTHILFLPSIALVMSPPTYLLYMPFMASTPPSEPPGDCPCGWFDGFGRMLNYFPGP